MRIKLDIMLDCDRKVTVHFLCSKEIKNVPERLKWHRYHRGLMQKEVAEKLGISRKSYTSLENGKIIHYEKQIVDKLAELYQISVKDLLDDYSYFLYYGLIKVWVFRLKYNNNKK